MKQLLFLFFILTQLFAYSQKKIYFDKNWKECGKSEAAYYRTIEKKETLYEIKDYFISGELQFEGLSHNDTDPLDMEGTVTWYYQNAKVSEKRTFSNHIPVGHVSAYYSNGVLKMFGKYKDGEYDSLYTEYFPSGSIARQAGFKKGIIDGTDTKYKSDNVLEFKVTYKMGVLDGPYEFYNGSGRLFNRGNAQNNFQQGKCYDYFYEGALRKEYTINNKKLDGWLIEYSDKGDTVGKGEFKEGVPLSYKMVAHNITNGSKFSAEMQLLNGIENWKIYRDSALIVKSFYDKGVKTGVWQIYTFDGSGLFETRDYKNSNCSEKYLQTVKEQFDPFFFLSDRFSFSSDVLDDDKCKVNVEEKSTNQDLHPFYHFKKSEKKTTKKNDNIVDYIDPTHRNDFAKKNNCVDSFKTYKEVSLCIRTINNTTYKVFISENTNILKQLKAVAKPADNEVYFYYQRFEDRIYNFDKEPRPERYMGIALPKVLKEAIKDKNYDELTIVGVLEHQFWNIDDFSGGAAFDAINEALKE